MRAHRLLAFLATLSLIVGLVSGCGSGPIIESDEAKKGIEAMSPLLPLIAEYKARTGTYPGSLDDLSIAEPVRERLSKLKKYQYKTWNKGTRFMIGFTMDRLVSNPWCGYDSDKGAWRCGLK